VGFRDRLHKFLVESVFPTRWDRIGCATPTIEIIGLLGLALMAFSLGLSNSGQSIGMGLLILASLLTWRTLWVGLREDWVARLVLIWFGFVLLRMIWAVWETPELMIVHLDRVRAFGRILLFPLACWWLGGERRSALSICILVLAGAVTNILYYGNWTHMDLLTLSQRLWFGGDPRMEGLLYVSILAGMIAFARSWWGSYFYKPVFFVRVLLWLMLYLLMLWALIAVQARAAWAAGAVIGLFFFARLIHGTLRRRTGGNLQHELTIALIFLVGTVVILGVFADTISNRLLEEHGRYELLIREDVATIEDRSVATRMFMIGVGWSAWLDRPLFGWGPGSSKHLISQADIPKEFQGNSELHNNYLEILVRLGIIGALLFFGFWFWLIVRFAKCVRTQKIPIDMGGFVISVSLLFFIVNFTDTYIDFQFGWFYMMFLCALLHSPLMRPATRADNSGFLQHARVMR
jgi:O-antigen ligase